MKPTKCCLFVKGNAFSGAFYIAMHILNFLPTLMIDEKANFTSQNYENEGLFSVMQRHSFFVTVYPYSVSV